MPVIRNVCPLGAAPVEVMVPVEVVPSPQLMVAVKSPTAPFRSASVNVATVTFVAALSSTAVTSGSLRPPAGVADSDEIGGRRQASEEAVGFVVRAGGEVEGADARPVRAIAEGQGPESVDGDRLVEAVEELAIERAPLSALKALISSCIRIAGRRAAEVADEQVAPEIRKKPARAIARPQGESSVPFEAMRRIRTPADEYSST